MKRLLSVLAAIAVAFVIYSLISGEDETLAPTPPRPIPTPTVTPTAARPTPVRPVPSPRPTTPRPNLLQRAQQTVQHSNRARSAPSPLAQRAFEVRRIIFECARRADWTITSYRQVANGISRVTGHAINDNVRNQRFLSELQRTGILLDLETESFRPFIGPGGRSYLECTFLIKWR